MKIQFRDKTLAFRDFAAGVYRAWGHRQANGLVKAALKIDLIEFRGRDRFVFI
jgi:hypothetical protein